MRKLALALVAGSVFAQIPAGNLWEPEAAEKNLRSSHPLILHTGFASLYRSVHIPGTVYVGPDSKPEGIEKLKETVAKEPRDREILIYCGCCPWEKCPNIRPAFAALHEMGFTRVSALHIPENLAKDWIDRGYPIDKRALDPAR